MDLSRFTRVDETTWRIEPHGAMRVPAIIYADEKLMRDMDDKVYDQAANVAMLPGIVQASYAMPDAHWGYGFPIGGVAAFDAEHGGVVSAGGVGFDISCGVRTIRSDTVNCCDASIAALSSTVIDEATSLTRRGVRTAVTTISPASAAASGAGACWA